jgi:hypothetical protein
LYKSMFKITEILIWSLNNHESLNWPQMLW